MARELEGLDKAHAELTDKVEAIKPKASDGTAGSCPAVALADLLEDKVDGFNLDAGDLLDIGPDDSMEEQDAAEAAKRKEELTASIRGLAKDLFAKA
eukprot:339314-Pyramimonas_sp.AAC.1